MTNESDSVLQALLRLAVMVSVVVVSGLAYKVYGPPASEWRSLIDPLLQTAQQWASPLPSSDISPDQAPAFTLDESSLGSLQAIEEPEMVALQALPDVAPFASARQEFSPLSGRGLLSDERMPSQVDAMVQKLRSLGADEFNLASWGAEGQMQRFECRAPMPGPAGFVRHFDAIEPSAELAVARVYQDLQHWHAQLASVAR